MTYNEMAQKVLEIFPLANFGEDLDGQIVVYTDKTLNPDGEVVALGPRGD